MAGPGRRRFLKSALGALLALPAGAAFAGTGGAAEGFRRAGLPAAPAWPVAIRQGDHFLVAGWVLTEADLGALGIAVPAPAPRRLAGTEQGAARAHDL